MTDSMPRSGDKTKCGPSKPKLSTGSQRVIGILRAAGSHKKPRRLDPEKIREAVWPTGTVRPTIDQVKKWVLELAQEGLILVTQGKNGYLNYQLLPPHSADPPNLENWRNHAALTMERSVVVEREGAGVSAGARASEHGLPQALGPGQDSGDVAGLGAEFRVFPARFCVFHSGGGVEDLDCRDCGTARGRSERHKELRQAHRRALRLPEGYRRDGLIAGFAAEMRAIEAADARARVTPPARPETLPGMGGDFEDLRAREAPAPGPGPGPDPFDDTPF
jgi:hypothetical protein